MKWVPLFGMVLLAGGAINGQSRSENRFLEYGVLNFSNKEGRFSLLALGPTESEFTLDAENQNSVTASRGSRFSLPPSAFIDQNGKAVRGKITFRIKEVIDALDFVTSGVHLNYATPSGEVQYFQSAGMFHVSAEKNGEELRLAPGKTITVDFPNIVPGDEFQLYKMDRDGAWKKSESQEQREERIETPREAVEIAPSMNDAPAGGGQPAALPPFEEPGTFTIGTRRVRIDGLTWWNFDSPYPHVACLKGELKHPTGQPIKRYQIVTIGINYKGGFSRSLTANRFKINAHRGKVAKILVVDQNGNIAISSAITVTNRKGFDKYAEGATLPEGEKNFCEGVGSLELKAVDQKILEDKEAFRNYLGLPREFYRINYPPEK